jgi:type IV pilus assembly protein PilF
MRRERMMRATAGAALALLLAACGAGTAPIVKKESAATKRQEAARVNTDLGTTYLRQGKLELALEKLTKALSFDKDYADAHTVIAALYDQIGNTAQAEEHYRRAAQLKPNGGLELNNYGVFLCKLGRYPESEEYFRRAVADPFYNRIDIALTNSGTCLLKAGKVEQAEQALRAALMRSPDNPEALFQLASVLYERHDYFKARAFIQRFESVSQPRPESLLLGRNIELRLGNAETAQDYTRRLLQGFPDSRQARALNGRNPS